MTIIRFWFHLLVSLATYCQASDVEEENKVRSDGNAMLSPF